MPVENLTIQEITRAQMKVIKQIADTAEEMTSIDNSHTKFPTIYLLRRFHSRGLKVELDVLEECFLFYNDKLTQKDPNLQPAIKTNQD